MLSDASHNFYQTGLCVYEVDDPSQRTEANDETARLTNRVAELEGVIREVVYLPELPATFAHLSFPPQMKNKPNPRWYQPSGSPQSDVTPDNWAQPSNQQPLPTESGSRSNSPSSTGASDRDFSEQSLHTRSPDLTRPSINKGANAYPTIALTVEPPPPGHASFAPSPQSTPSPLVSATFDERSQGPVSAVQQQEFDVAAMLLYSPSFSSPGVQEDYSGVTKDPMTIYSNQPQPEEVYCGCADEGATYNVLLELSLRLRKAAGTMARSPGHQCSGTCCALYRQVSELDKYLS